MSSHTLDTGQGCFDRGPLICGPNKLFAKPYAVGASVDVRLFRGLSVESGFLYERFHRDLTEGLVVFRGGGANFGQKYSASADGWLFPFLAKYTFTRRRIAPFVVAGATLRHLGPFNGQGVQLDFFLQPQPASVHFETGRDLDVALTAGGGLRVRVSFIDIAPEIRFMHWTSTYYQPVQNAAMLMLSVSFPARR